MTYGADCTWWDEGRAKFCGAPARWVRLRADDVLVVDMLCDQHARAGDTVIPAGATRAQRSVVWRGYRFVTSLAS